MQNAGAFLERRTLGVHSMMVQADKNLIDFSLGYRVITMLNLTTIRIVVKKIFNLHFMMFKGWTIGGKVRNLLIRRCKECSMEQISLF